MEWTTEAPQECGWYWHRSQETNAPNLAQVFRVRKGEPLQVQESGHVSQPLSDYESEWAGPIPLPEGTEYDFSEPIFP